MAKIQCDNKKCRFRTEEDFCKFKEIVKDKNGNCKTFAFVDNPHEIVITLPTKDFAEKCKKMIERYIQKEIGYDCEIREKFKE